jgi:hypothetical protein
LDISHIMKAVARQIAVLEQGTGGGSPPPTSARRAWTTNGKRLCLISPAREGRRAVKPIKRMTRQQLYELVWSKPMRDAAHDHDISNVGLKRVCLRQGVPVPPRGYWNKKRAGHKVPPPPRPKLPPAAVGQSNEFALFAPPPLHGAALQSQLALKAKEKAKHGRPSVARSHGLSSGAESKKVAASSRVATKTRKRKKHRGRYERVHFTMPIGRWEWDYGYGINRLKKWVRGHFLENRDLKVRGRLIRPHDLAGTPVCLWFLTFDAQNAHYVEPPTSVGSLHWDRETKGYEVRLFMPRDVLPSLLPLLIAEKLRYVVFHGSPLVRGQCEIEGYQFEAEVDHEVE